MWVCPNRSRPSPSPRHSRGAEGLFHSRNKVQCPQRLSPGTLSRVTRNPVRLFPLTIICLITVATPLRADDTGPQFFESKIRPLLVDHCYSCHSAQAKK